MATNKLRSKVLLIVLGTLTLFMVGGTAVVAASTYHPRPLSCSHGCLNVQSCDRATCGPVACLNNWCVQM